MLINWYRFSSPVSFYPLAGSLSYAAGVLAALLAGAGLFIGLFVAPTDATQGDAYRIIYRSGLAWEEMLDALRMRFTTGPAAEFAPFFATGKRGFVQERRTPPGAIVRLVRDDAEDADFRSEAPAVPLLEAEKKVG